MIDPASDNKATIGSASIADRIRFLLSCSPAVIYSCEPTRDCPTTFISDNVQTQFGYEPACFLNDPFFWTKCLHPEDSPGVLDKLTRLEDEARLEYEYRFRHREGHYVWLHDQLALLRDGNGRKVAIVGSWFNVSARKGVEAALRASEERIRVLFESAVDPLWDWDVVADQTSFSPSWAGILGYEPGELNPAVHTWESMLHSDDRPRVMKMLKECLRGDRAAYEAEYRLRTKGGDWKHVLSRGRVVTTDRHGHGTRMIGSISDISALRRAEEALRRANDDLDERVRQRTVELTESNEQLQREIAERLEAEARMKRLQEELAHVARVSTMGEMASSLAHELNQPLSAMLNYATGCERRLAGAEHVDDGLRRALRGIAEQAAHAGEIIQRIRGFVRKGALKRSSVRINEVVREVSQLAGVDAARRQTAVRLQLSEDLPLIQADSIQIQQVLLNLLHNALEAMAGLDPAERVVTVRTKRRDAGGVAVAVVDQGTGLAADDVNRVFDPFYTTKQQGMGLGLSISKSIVEAHAGTIRACPGSEGGCTFWIELPGTGGEGP